MANGKYRYRIKRYLDSIPEIEVSEKVEVPNTIYYGNLIILTNAHNTAYYPENRYTLASAEKENGNFGKITILSGKNAGNVYEHVPYHGGNFHFNEYKGDSYFGVNFNRHDEQKDKTDKNSMVIVSAINSIVEEANKKAEEKAKKEYEDLKIQIFNRPEY